MLARLSLASAFLLVLFLPAPGRADERQFGDLDFSRLSRPQEQFFWRRLRALAFEEAAITYCGRPDDFERQAKQGIRSCVTADALNKAQSVFESEMKAALSGFREKKIACNTKPAATSAWLGVDLSPVGKDGADKPRVGPGALVAGAFDDSPAAAAGLAPGDVITSVNGETVAGPKELSAKIRALSPGATVRLGLLRDGVGRSASVKLGAMAFDRQGRIAVDMPTLVESSKQDLKSVSDQVAEMCSKCKTSIWAVFCR
jgi:hypothetical protein